MSTIAADDIRDRVVGIYRSLSPGGRPPRDDGRGDLDSMAFLEFILSIEREFEIIVDVTELDDGNFATTAAATEFVKRKLSTRRP